MSDNRILYVRDKNTRSIISIQEGYLSLTWTERYQEAGEFVLDLPVTADNIDLYQEGRYISRDDTDESMVIDTIDITESFGDEKKPVLEVKGRTLSSLLTRRVNASRIDDYYKDGFVNYSGTISEVCTGIINDDMISPIKVDYEWFHLDSETGKWVEGYDGDFGAHNEVRPVFSDDPSRAVPNVSVVCDSSLAHIDMDFSFSKFMTIYDILNAISKRYVTGFKVILDKSNNFVVRIYKGSDRTRKNRTLDPIIFDPIMDNISYVNYFNDYTDYKNYWMTHTNNYVLVNDPNSIGPILYNGYVWDSRGTRETGFFRRETVFDGSSVVPVDNQEEQKAQEEGDSSESSEITTYSLDDSTEEETKEKNPDELLLEYGKEQMSEGDYDIVEVSEGAIDPLVRYKYGEDYFIGDSVEITQLNNTVMIGIIDEIVFSYDSDGITVTPNFANMQDYDYGEEDAS